MDILKINNLTTGYTSSFFQRETIILSKISVSFKKGIIYGLVGPNGSGKTTLFKTILNLIPKFEGEIKIFGADLNSSEKELLKNVGYVPEEALMPGHLTAYQFLSIYGGILFSSGQKLKKGIWEKLAIVELASSKDELISTFSKGMKKRLLIAHAILNEPDLLILDEPFGGLDPKQRKSIKKIFNFFSSCGTTIIISSHELYELQAICQQIMMLNNGDITEFNSSKDFDL